MWAMGPLRRAPGDPWTVYMGFACLHPAPFCDYCFLPWRAPKVTRPSTCSEAVIQGWSELLTLGRRLGAVSGWLMALEVSREDCGCIAEYGAVWPATQPAVATVFWRRYGGAWVPDTSLPKTRIPVGLRNDEGSAAHLTYGI